MGLNAHFAVIFLYWSVVRTRQRLQALFRCFFIVDDTITSGAVVMFGTRCLIKMFNRPSCFPGFILRPWCSCLASLLPVFFFSKSGTLLWTVPFGIYLF